MTNFLILGDIHFGSFAEHPDFLLKARVNDALLTNPQPMVEGLIKTASSLCPKIDGILVPGDLTSTAEPAEFLECQQVIEKIAKGLNVPSTAIYTTFGNHDVNWSISQIADGVAGRPQDLAYKTIAAHVGAVLLDANEAEMTGPLPGSGYWVKENYDLVMLNTGFECCHDQKLRNGNLGQLQVAWLNTLPNPMPGKLRILTLHHHPINLPYPTVVTDTSTLAEGADLVVEIARLGVDFVVHGHRHHPFLHTEMKQGWTKPVSFLCAGSVGVGSKHRQGGDIPNLFHIVCFDSRAPSGAVTGVVHTQAYRVGTGWAPTPYSKEVPLDARQPFGGFATLDDAAKAFATQLQLKESTGVVKLPAFQDLPLEVRSRPVAQVNEIVSSVLSGQGFSMVGLFPDAVIAMK